MSAAECAVEYNAFNGCKKLKSDTIGKFVATIENKTFFKYTVLKKITIPVNVTKIGKKAYFLPRHYHFAK